MKITLASTSKFKTNILNTVKIKHDNIAPIGEEISKETDAYKYVKELSYNKATSIRRQVKEGIIIGLDTIVLINHKIVEKPKSYEEARLNLKNSSNNTTQVITGITLINQETEEVITDYQETLVTFKEIKDDDIEFYLENEKDALYASGFIIETIASNFIKEIKGSYYNILGVPVEKIYEILNSMNIYIKDIS